MLSGQIIVDRITGAELHAIDLRRELAGANPMATGLVPCPKSRSTQRCVDRILLFAKSSTADRTRLQTQATIAISTIYFQISGITSSGWGICGAFGVAWAQVGFAFLNQVREACYE